MRVGIDASNIRGGGTTTHLVELLAAAEPSQCGFEEVIVWASRALLDRIEARSWLAKSPQPQLEQATNPRSDRRQARRVLWQRAVLPGLLKAHRCDILYVPGGMDHSGYHPMVTMSRDMLVFDLAEARRYGWSLASLRLWVLRLLQARTFRAADGLIFLTQYAQSVVSSTVRLDPSRAVVVPHGVSRRFLSPPREQLEIQAYSPARPYRILYVSSVDLYKHQWHVAEAVVRLRSAGFPVSLDLVGPAYPAGMRRLSRELGQLANSADCVRYLGAVAYDRLHEVYAAADMKVFASSCENMPNTLLEAMLAGLPIASSRRGPMPEILGDAGTYFDPESPAEIYEAIAVLLNSPDLRKRNAAAAVARAQEYSWKRCARETLTYLAQCAHAYERSKR